MPERLLVLAPRGRDAAVVLQVLHKAGIQGCDCPDLQALRRRLEGDVGGVLLTEESLVAADPGFEPLMDWIAEQPPWSDLPVIVLAVRQSGRRTGAASQVLQRLGNVVLLERPINAETLASAAAASLRARRRQYQARRLNETLESRVVERTRALGSAHETLAFVLDGSGVGSWQLDLATGAVRGAAVHGRLLGHDGPIPDWSLARFLALVVPEDRDAVAGQIAAATGVGHMEYECGIVRLDGERRWINVRGRVEQDEAGHPVRMAGVVSDITDRRRTEDALHQAQKMEAIGQLTGGVAHDFNNLLTVIVGGLDMIIRKPERVDRVVRLAEAALVAAGRGEQLTQQLLAFSRRQMLRPAIIDPCRTLAAFESLARRAAGESVTLSSTLKPGCGAILVDPAQFEAAVLNLVVNARDAIAGARQAAGADGGVQGEIRLSCTAGPADGVLVSVSDDGTGFSRESLARAFEPFFTTKEVGKGSGLGLAQVYGFMRSAGGEATIESEPGSGTRIVLRFPRAAGVPAPDCHDVTAAPPQPTGRLETVLLVEDDEPVRAMAIESLEELRYTVLVARDVPEALERLRGDGVIDLLFSDVVMPGRMNGVALAREARRLRPGLKVLLTSGYVGQSGADQVVSDDLPVLTKPYRRDELARQLRLVLSAEG